MSAGGSEPLTFGAADHRRDAGRLGGVGTGGWRTSMLRVMHVITGLGTGGAERMLAQLVLAPRPAPIESVVVSLVGGGAVAEDIRAGGVPVFDLGMRRGRPDPRIVWRLAGLIRRFEPAVVQSWMYHADLAAVAGLALSGRRRRTRLYWGIRCSDLDLSRYSRLLRATVRMGALLSRLPDGVVANARSGLETHLSLGYRPRMTAVIPNGIDCGRFRPDPVARDRIRQALGLPSARVAAIHAARLDAMKDHGCFLEALRLAPGVTGIAVGEGTETIAQAPNLIRLGRRGDMAELFAAADIVVSSSAFGEGFSNAIAEGMATGLPAVATTVGDAASIVGEAGILVPPRDPPALARALRTLGDDAARRADLGAEARARIVGEFSLDRAVAAFDRLHWAGAVS